MIDMLPTYPRRVLRISAVALGLVAGSLSAPAFAAPPTAWDEPATFSGLERLVVLFLIPLAVIAVIALLTYLPSLIKGQSKEAALVFQDRHEWFGGPRSGVEATQGAGEPVDSSSKGGSGAGW